MFREFLRGLEIEDVLAVAIIGIVLGLASSFDTWGRESRIKIGIIDTGISYQQAHSPILCENGNRIVLQGATSIYDIHGHGTNIFGIITKNLNPKKYCVISYKYTDGKSGNIEGSLDQVIKDGVRFINLSLNGSEIDMAELRSILTILRTGADISVAAGNDGLDLDKKCSAFPSCYKKIINSRRFHVVGAINAKFSNFGSIVETYETGIDVGSPMMSGTSQATAIFTNKLILKK